ncbi:helix-turn-helix domain-containing protein [Novosphingobium cyanobacteriorum]|uniref:Helix-turn-helix domain-containing protein n=1 Tax=Novosphingobium cyanobacteriorum TaxID=3024215 RepID=A0ABT6CK11_9SPHN|nr:helix-turn-helix domain-containing protein [Novosphingobium cyanobacteriorum]MDF8334141.1 helix-turn-helix domain-containing protein [Novosphingobium cyanobacteriorum]
MHIPAEPLAYSVADACRVSTLCKSQIYNMIRSGKLEARKLGRRTLIPAASLRALIEGGAA